MTTTEDITVTAKLVPSTRFKFKRCYYGDNGNGTWIVKRKGRIAGLGGALTPRAWLKRFIATVPGFKSIPVFAVRQGMLEWRGRNSIYRLNPALLGLERDALVEGQYVVINLSSFQAKATE